MQLFGISNCDKVRAAKKWLAHHQLPVEFIDFRKHPLTEGQIQHWLDTVGADALLNKKSTTWRKLDNNTQASIQDTSTLVTLLLQQPTLIKRPVLVTDQDVFVGFTEAQYHRIFA